MLGRSRDRVVAVSYHLWFSQQCFLVKDLHHLAREEITLHSIFVRWRSKRGQGNLTVQQSVPIDLNTNIDALQNSLYSV
jgi:hypothetical protein